MQKCKNCRKKRRTKRIYPRGLCYQCWKVKRIRKRFPCLKAGSRRGVKSKHPNQVALPAQGREFIDRRLADYEKQAAEIQRQMDERGVSDVMDQNIGLRYP